MATGSLPGIQRSRSPARAEARPACGVAGRCRAAGRAAHARSARRTAPGPALPGARPVARPDSRPSGVRYDRRRRRQRRTPRRRRSQTIAAAEGLARSTRTRSMRSGAFWGRRIRRSRAVAIVEGGRPCKNLIDERPCVAPGRTLTRSLAGAAAAESAALGGVRQPNIGGRVSGPAGRRCEHKAARDRGRSLQGIRRPTCGMHVRPARGLAVVEPAGAAR